MNPYASIPKFDKFYPIISTLIGTFFVLLSGPPAIFPLAGLIIYASTQVWLKQKNLAEKPELATLGILVCNIGLLLYFSVTYSYFILPIFLILTFFIQTETVFKSLNLQRLYTFLYTYVSVILVNLVSYYFQARYLSIAVTLKVSLVITTGFILSALYNYRMNKGPAS